MSRQPARQTSQLINDDDDVGIWRSSWSVGYLIGSKRDSGWKDTTEGVKEGGSEKGDF